MKTSRVAANRAAAVVTFDEHDKPVTMMLTDYARQKVQEHFATLDDLSLHLADV